MVGGGLRKAWVIMTAHRCQCFLCPSDSRLRVSPQVVHLFVKTELHSKQSSTKKPAIIVEGYLICQCVMHSAMGFSALLQKKDMMVKLVSGWLFGAYSHRPLGYLLSQHRGGRPMIMTPFLT